MKPANFLRFAQFRLYWSSRKKIGEMLFWFRKKSYQITTSLRSGVSSSRSLSAILSVAKGWFLAAVITCVILTKVDPHFAPYFKRLGVLVPSDTDYVTFLAAIGSIGAVFIGLYYAAIASVGGAIYARVPNNLRDLLAQERFGNQYIKLLAFLTVLCLLLIASKLSGCERNYTAIIFVTIGAGLGVFAFVKLGQRVFNLFDPTSLSYHVFEQLRDRLRMVIAGGYRWQDPSFQNHAYKQAERTVGTLETLLDITIKEPHLNGSPLVALAMDTTKFLVSYCFEKSKIPTNSKWFEQVYSHRDWYRTPDHQLSIAIETGTALTPEQKGNGQWIEERLHQILDGCLRVNAEAERWTYVLTILEHVKFYVTMLAQSGYYDAGFSRIMRVADIVVDALIANPLGSSDDKRIREKLAVADSIAVLPIAYCIAVQTRIRSINRQDVVDRLGEINWKSSASLYMKRFPTYSVEQLEYLAPRLTFEQAIEEEVVTPIWCQADLVLRPESEAFVSSVKTQVEGIKDFYSETILKLSAANALWLSAAFSSRQCEYWNKLERQSFVWEDVWDDISLKRRYKGLPWPDFENNAAKGRVEIGKSGAIEVMAGLIYPLSQQERPDSLPDYAGQFLLMTGEAALDSIISPNALFFKKIFRSYFIGCLFRFEKLRPASMEDWRWKQDIRIAASTLLDVMDISGYALLLSQVHGDEASWLEVKNTWDGYLKIDNDDQSRVKWLCALVSIAESGFSILPRGILRTTWQSSVSRKLDELFPVEEKLDRWGVRKRRKVENASRLVQAVAEDPEARSYDGVDIFVALYLKELKGSDDLDIRGQRESLLSELSEEDEERDV